MRKIISWVTPDCFVDCDIVLMPGLLKYFDIYWFVILAENSRYKEVDFNLLLREHRNLKIIFVYERYRLRNPLNMFTYISLSRKIKKVRPDGIYLNVSVSPWCLAMIPFIKSVNTVVTAHQGRVHEGMGHKRVIMLARSFWYGHFKNVNMFSSSQAALMKDDFPNAKIYQFVLGLKDFGIPTNVRPNNDIVKFLSFGTLNYAKNIDLLIDAACMLYDRGVRGFKVSINGSCKDWSWYQKHIKYAEIFELDIRMIDNSEIPNLFNGAHYLVQPYRVVSQSGPTKIAFNYNLPIIVSNLPGFMDELVEGVNGYSFNCGDVKSLADRMQQLIETHSDYPQLLERMMTYTKEHYAGDKLTEKYRNMIEEVMTSKEKAKSTSSLMGYLKTSRIVLFFRLIVERVSNLVNEARFIANGQRYKDPRKMKSDLQIRVHAIEKGMSIGIIKKGFGNKKACAIADDLRVYMAIGGEKQFLVESCSVLRQFVRFKEELCQEAEDVNAKLNALVDDYSIDTLDQGGVYKLKYEKIKEMANGKLPEVMASRYAVRDFCDRPIDMELLRKALQMAEKSPSACNRQSWRIHVYKEVKAQKLFLLQGGSNGFEQDMQVAILVCCDLRSYFLDELNLPYVDGGLYAMNLMLALHYYGLACIPLTMGRKARKLKIIKKEMNIPNNEVPILLIGVGSYKDEYRVAVSSRYPYHQYTTFED